MVTMNPMSDDLGNAWFNDNHPPKSEPKRAWTGPVETLEEREENDNRVDAIYGPQEPRVQYRDGRPVRPL